MLTAGTHNFKAVYASANPAIYPTGTSNVASVTVAQATPTLQWPAPLAIAYGTALGSTQLDATASVPATFVYNPAAGATLSAGTHSLSVTFTPADIIDYATATASVSLIVNKATPSVSWATPVPIT